MKISPTALRKNLYQLLDQVLESGEPIYIKRKGRELMISEKKNKAIYEIMDSRMNEVNEIKPELDENKLQALDENWEENWEQKWDEWLSEK
jgi:PHD/YefM family antitoxin component YafN of YafNO toxin-antitoxin module